MWIELWNNVLFERSPINCGCTSGRSNSITSILVRSWVKVGGRGEDGKKWAVWEFHVMGCTYVGIGTSVRPGWVLYSTSYVPTYVGHFELP